jgi:hypothetical protein
MAGHPPRRRSQYFRTSRKIPTISERDNETRDLVKRRRAGRRLASGTAALSDVNEQTGLGLVEVLGLRRLRGAAASWGKVIGAKV